MSDRLPPLTALRAFDAAARHMSFTAAANELSVTPAALSFQIKNLEEYLGTPLFIRLNRAVELTPAGRTLAPGVATAFEGLGQAWQKTRKSTNTKRLTITSGPAFMAKWIAPRLGSFSRVHPDVELLFSASLAVLDFTRDNIDLAVRFGVPNNDENYFEEYLLDEWILPFARPDIAARLSKPEDLLNENLIRDESLSFMKKEPNWQAWFKEAGVESGHISATTFNQADHAIDMALQGAGVALGRHSIAYSALESGALVAPFAIGIKIDPVYRIRCPKGQETRPLNILFRKWLHTEAAKCKAPFAV